MGAASIDLSQVRHPRERRVVILSVAANLAIVAAAVAVILLAPGWLSSHPRAAAAMARVRLVALAAVLVLPLLGFLRLARWMLIHENAVRAGPDQLPQLHEVLRRQCRTLGIAEPALYVTTLSSVGLSDAIALGRDGPRAIVLGDRLFGGLDGLEARRDVFAFVLAHELGRIVLGHASWRSELLAGYLKRIPVLRLPLVRVQTYSRDLFAARLAPEGVRGLIVSACGGEILDHVGVAAFLRDALAPPPRSLAARVAAMARKEPHVAERLRELHRHGLLAVEAKLRTGDEDPGERTQAIAPRGSPA
ncbi:M48 family metallopeptidase [Anaeromyxobacter sp. Fw109-5]|uniref:M48 family metallopeptidase n=1 Tax=Anaeromyxobacter sp. (strain Fw109-5) TaxID=404589 RepID=UPI000158A72A|nr:M48 family metallopeptidase [Anaeromyxobacter sp. Fw109-5]ABS26908.1 hypothetical protein Anae109_2707 [Anaeromyxobacter sp. Fw109-5]